MRAATRAESGPENGSGDGVAWGGVLALTGGDSEGGGAADAPARGSQAARSARARTAAQRDEAAANRWRDERVCGGGTSWMRYVLGAAFGLHAVSNTYKRPIGRGR